MNIATLKEFDSSEELQIGAATDKMAKLVRVVDAIKKVTESEAWSSLKTEVFDPEVERQRKLLFQEARKEHPDLQVLANLNGKYEMAKKYHDLHEFAKERQTELTNLRVKYGKTTQRPESAGQFDL